MFYWRNIKVAKLHTIQRFESKSLNSKRRTKYDSKDCRLAFKIAYIQRFNATIFLFVVMRNIYVALCSKKNGALLTEKVFASNASCEKMRKNIAIITCKTFCIKLCNDESALKRYCTSYML